MFEHIFELGYVRNWKEAIGFYLAYLFMLAVCLGIIVGIVGIVFGAIGYGTSEYISNLMFGIGNVAAIILDVTLAILIVKRKSLLKSFESILMIGAAGLLSVFGAGMLGLIPVAVLTTKKVAGQTKIEDHATPADDTVDRVDGVS